MEKKIYQAPSTEYIYIASTLSLLGLSVDKGVDYGYGEGDAKKTDFFEEEPAEVGGRFNIWDD